VAQAFSNFYQKYSIIHEESREKKVFSAMDDGFLREATGADSGGLGIQIPVYM